MKGASENLTKISSVIQSQASQTKLEKGLNEPRETVLLVALVWWLGITSKEVSEYIQQIKLRDTRKKSKMSFSWTVYNVTVRPVGLTSLSGSLAYLYKVVRCHTLLNKQHISRLLQKGIFFYFYLSFIFFGFCVLTHFLAIFNHIVSGISNCIAGNKSLLQLSSPIKQKIMYSLQAYCYLRKN